MNFARFLGTIFFAEHLRVTASDIRMQIAVICNLNLSLQFVTIDFTFSVLRVFTLAHVLMSLNFYVHLLLVTMPCKAASNKK